MSLLSAYPCFGSDKKKYRALSLNFGKSHLPSFSYYNLVNGMLGNRYGGNFTLGLTDNLLIQAKSSYSVAKGSFYNYINGEEDLNQKIIYKQISFFEPAVLINSFKTKKFIFYSGIGYQKIDENSRRHPLDGRNPDSDIDYSGFVILYCIGSEYYIKLDRFCCFFQFKQKIGSTDYEFNSKRVLSYPEGIIKGNVSLNGFEIVLGFKIFI